jgi:hypothetical protein
MGRASTQSSRRNHDEVQNFAAGGGKTEDGGAKIAGQKRGTGVSHQIT